MLDHPHRRATETGYALWAERLVAEGWTPYFLSFMFRPMEAERYGKNYETA